jgi:hypothetical protein
LSGGFPAFGLNPFVDLFPMHGHVGRRFNPHPNLIALNTEDCEPNIIADCDDFAYAAGEDQHMWKVSPWFIPMRRS